MSQKEFKLRMRKEDFERVDQMYKRLCRNLADAGIKKRVSKNAAIKFMILNNFDVGPVRSKKVRGGVFEEIKKIM